MIELNPEALRPRLDLEGRYVDFSLLRSAMTVEKLVRDLGVNLSQPTKEGECRAACPKCKKEKSFVLNVNTNRFNCFAKGCFLKGGGVIDLFAKLYEVTAKEASHLLACAYGIQPYSSDPTDVLQPVIKPLDAPLEKTPAAVRTRQPEQSREAVSREEFDALSQKVERLSMIVWSKMFENGEIQETDVLFDEQTDYEFQNCVSG